MSGYSNSSYSIGGQEIRQGGGTVVVHRKFRDFDVLIDRTTKWGNPFIIGVDGNREEVIDKYREWIKGQPELLACLGELRGKRLGCWCRPAACHGDVLAALCDE